MAFHTRNFSPLDLDATQEMTTAIVDQYEERTW